MVQPPAPTLDNVRLQFQQSGQPPLRELAPKANNQELITELKDLKQVILSARKIDIALSTTNQFQSGAVNDGTFAKTVQDQQYTLLYNALRELDRRAN